MKRGNFGFAEELLFRENIKGEVAPQISPLDPLMGSGAPRGPVNEVYRGMKLSKTRHAENALCGAQWIDEVVGTGVLNAPPTTSNVQLRYPKNEPLLLSNVKNAAIGGIIKYS